MRALLLACGLAAMAFVPGPARAQSPGDALANGWLLLCPGAAPGSDLATRCAEIFAGGPGSRDASADGNFLGEIPGQGRAATRDNAPDEAAAAIELAPGLSVFASAEGGRLKRRGGVNEAPFDGDASALSAGLDWSPSPAWRLGLVANVAEEQLDFLGSAGSADVRFSGLMAMASWSRGAFAVDAYAGRLSGDYDLVRAIDYTLLSGVSFQATARASVDARRELAGLGITWSHATGAWEWQLGTGVDWQATAIERYEEGGGGGLAIAVPARTITSRRGRADLTLARSWSRGWGVLQPMLRLGWRHEFANPARPISVTFLQDAAGTPIRFQTDDPDADWGDIGLGAVFVFTGGHSGFVEWRRRIGHAFLDEAVLAVGWRWELP